MGVTTSASIWLVRLTCFMLFAVVSCQSPENEYSRLVADIYNRTSIMRKVPPNLTAQSTDVAILNVSITILDVISIDQVEQVLNSIMYVSITWMNKDLQWRPEDYGGLNVTTIDSSTVWVPRLVVAIGPKDSLYVTIPDTLILYSNGLTRSANHQYISFRCRVDFTRYPFDVQRCGFGLYPVNYPYPTLSLREEYLNNSGLYDLFGEWLLVNHTREMVTKENLGPYPRVTLTVKRKPVYYVIVLIFPMVLTSVLTPLVFLIPAETGDKMSYLVAILTSAAIFITMIGDAMPRGLSSTPYLAMLLIEVMMEGLCAILASLLVVNKYGRERGVSSTLTKAKLTIDESN
ncbi:hypothetical protein Btru_038685 [Bulinus truncatus]|nr:hypothetical protein Btru_038685 [Bulinus truncatus]